MASDERPGAEHGYDEIHVRLLDEAIDAWRPVKAYRISDDTAVISHKQPYKRDTEEWEFEPGSIVITARIIRAPEVFTAAVGRRKYYRIDEDHKLRWCHPDQGGRDDRF